MTDEKKIWLCEQYAQKAWALSLNLAQEAARAGNSGKGYAVVASEARNLANNLFKYSANARFDQNNENEFNNVVNIAFMTGLLSINAMIEILYVSEFDDRTNNKSIIVCVEDLRKLALELNELGGKKLWQRTFVIPEILTPVKTTRKIDYFFKFSIGENTLVENVLNVREIWFGSIAETSGKIFNIRGYGIPIIDCAGKFNLNYSRLNNDTQTVMIIDFNKLTGKKEEFYAVLIDDLDINTIFPSKIGRAVSPKAGNIFSDYSRECWDAVGNDQFVFPDWLKLVS